MNEIKVCEDCETPLEQDAPDWKNRCNDCNKIYKLKCGYKICSKCNRLFKPKADYHGYCDSCNISLSN